MTVKNIILSTQKLRDQIGRLRFAAPVEYVYNPLEYAWHPHEKYLRKYGKGKKRVVFLGMNPGPFGMAQTGVPFGEVEMVRNWLKIVGSVKRPKKEHPKRPIQGFDCLRSEVSGRRFWGLFQAEFSNADDFFKDHFVINYCPLIFLEDTGRNRTPDKLKPKERAKIGAICDAHLVEVIEEMNPEWLIGVGKYAEDRFRDLFPQHERVARVLHPSPASPLANRGWAELARRQLFEVGVWGH